MIAALPPAEELPGWIRRRARQAGLLGGGGGSSRLRVLTMGLLCITFGYLMTEWLSSPSGEILEVTSLSGRTHHQLSTLDRGENLAGSDGYDDAQVSSALVQTGTTTGRVESGTSTTSPSIKGALSELHHAVGGAISSWKTAKRPTRAGTSGRHRHKSGGILEVERYNASKDSSIIEEIIAPGRDLLGERTRVGKVTIIFGGAATYERAIKTHEAHDRIHGYPLHVLRHGIMDDVWSKPAYILNLLLRELSKPESERLQWLLWIDADTILLNPFVPIETFLPPSPEFDDVHLVVTNDWNGLNNGVFPIRVNQWAVDLFAAIVSFRHYKPDVELVFRDQSAMDMLLKDHKFAKHTIQAPQRWFNAYQGEQNETLAPFQVRRGDFLVHFAGVGDRDQRMAYWLDRVEQHLPDWELEVQHTSYPSEAREFWSQQRHLRSDTARSLEEAKTKANELLQKIEEHLDEYRVRLESVEIEQISEKEKKVRDAIEAQDPDISTIIQATEELNQVSAPLDAARAESSKTLLKQAHEALFAAEKEMLRHEDKASGTETQALQEKIVRLRDLVMQPSWTKAELREAVEDARKAQEAVVQAEVNSSSAISGAAAEPKVNSIEEQSSEASTDPAMVEGRQDELSEPLRLPRRDEERSEA
ncbi:hypothetical protein ANO11243_013530 [Dothideomycetidae sp. 11243]|nr:hypothetical protein ANO11243_013530 [fungal sp. No.11243]